MSGGLQGGVGSASVSLAPSDDFPDGVVVGAIAVVNSAGSVIDAGAGLPWEAAGHGLVRPSRVDRDALEAHRISLRPPLNTTIGVVATSAALGKAECHKLASVSHDGLARAIRPAHSMFDGDTVFALSTGRQSASRRRPPRSTAPPARERAVALSAVFEAGATAFAIACTRAVLAAASHRGGPPAYRDLCPSAFRALERARRDDAPRCRCSPTPAAMQQWSDDQRVTGRRVAVVPTMGALHAGHLALVDVARRHADVVVVTVFVNPLQFNSSTDFDHYPRPIDDDLAACAAAGVDAVYAPTAAAMYPAGFQTHVEPGSLADRLEGEHRPGHFRGVTTVVAKLFGATRPHLAVFGQKDAQQLAIVRRMTTDLDLGVEIVAMPTIREPDGLAMSSRNRRLDPADRAAAPCIWRGLSAVQAALTGGERDIDVLAALAIAPIAAEPRARLEYLEVVHPDSFDPLTGHPFPPDGRLLVVAAVWFGDVRLIDNLPHPLTARNGRQRSSTPDSANVIATVFRIAWAMIVGPMRRNRYSAPPRTAPTEPSTRMRPMLPRPRTGSKWAMPNSTACRPTAITGPVRPSSERSTTPRNTISSTRGAATTASTSSAIT